MKTDIWGYTPFSDTPTIFGHRTLLLCEVCAKKFLRAAQYSIFGAESLQNSMTCCDQVLIWAAAGSQACPSMEVVEIPWNPTLANRPTAKIPGWQKHMHFPWFYQFFTWFPCGMLLQTYANARSPSHFGMSQDSKWAQPSRIRNAHALGKNIETDMTKGMKGIPEESTSSCPEQETLSAPEHSVLKTKTSQKGCEFPTSGLQDSGSRIS